MNLLDYALKYHDLGFSILRLRYKDKIPGVNGWKNYQEIRATQNELMGWFNQPANIGLIMGDISGGIIALDFDDQDAWERWYEQYPLDTAIAKTSKGYHVLVRLPTPCPSNWKMIYQGKHVGETRANGGYIVAPPSTHPTGDKYTWVFDPFDFPIAHVNSLADIGISQAGANDNNLADDNNLFWPEPGPGQNPLPRRTLEFMANGILSAGARGVNDELFNAAIQHSAAGYTEGETVDHLLPVAHRHYIGTGPGNSENQAIATIKSGWKHGQAYQPIYTNGHHIPEETDPDPEQEALDSVELKSEFTPNYALEKGCMFYITYKTDEGQVIKKRKLIAPFWCQITEKLTIFDESGQRVIYKMNGEKGHRKFSLETTSEDWADPKKLTVKLLQHLPGLPPSTETRFRSHWGPAISAISEESQMKEVKALASTGWSPDGKCFVMPGGSVGDSYICKLDEGLEPELSKFGLVEQSIESNKAVVDALLGLAVIYRPSVIFTLIAHCFLPPLIQFCGNELRYLYHIHAQTGSLKTELAKIMMSLYGPLGSHAITYKWNSTPYGAESRANALKDCLMLIDDLKPGTLSDTDTAKWVAFVQAAVDAQGRKRATISSKALISMPPRALLLSTGEAVPEAGEASYTARMLLAETNTQPSGRNLILDEIKQLTPKFAGVMFDYIKWLIKGKGQNVQSIYKDITATSNLDSTAHARLASNYAANRLGAIMFANFCLDRSYIDEETKTAYLADHDAGLRSIVEYTARKAESERYSQRFIYALQDAISTGFATISDHLDRGMKRIGWQDKDNLYLLSGAKEIVDQWLRQSGQNAIHIPKRELSKQLYDDGYSRSTSARIERGFYDLQAVDPATEKRVMITCIDLNTLGGDHETNDLHEKSQVVELQKAKRYA